MNYTFNKILLFFFSILISCQLISQSTFQRTYGSSALEEFAAIEKTLDNGFIVLGTTSSPANGGKDILVFKIDAAGDIVWSKSIGSSADDVAQYIIFSWDGNYVISGYTYINGQDNPDAFLMKIDVFANIIWAKVYSTDTEDFFAEIVETKNGYLSVGSTKYIGNSQTDALVASVDKFGNLNWAKSFGEPSNDLFANIITSSDGNYIASGSFSEGDVDHYNCKAMKFNESGSVIWYNIFASNLFEVARSLTLANDGGYIAVGTTDSYSSSDNDFLVYKINENGSLAWSKVYGGNKDEKAQSIINIDCKEYLITGFTDSYGFGSRDVFATRIDNNGNLKWSKAYGSADWDGNFSTASNSITRSSIYLQNSGFIIADQTKGFAAASGDIYLIKTDTLGDAADCNVFDVSTNTNSFPLNVYIGNPDIQNILLTFKALDFTSIDVSLIDSNVCKCFIKVDLGEDVSFCKGSSVLLDAGIDNASYLWNDNSTAKTLNVISSGKYFVTVIDSKGCTGVDSVNVFVNPFPVVDLGKDTTICPGKNIIFDAANPGADYLWNTASDKQTITVSDAGKYSVTVTDKNGCTASDSVNLFLKPLSILNLGKDMGFCNGNSFTLNAGNNFINYLWQDGSFASSFNVTEPGKYWLDALDQYQCNYSDTVNVIDTCGYYIFIPNAFTPDGDALNDTFRCVAFGIETFNMLVFNRWGALIFSSDNITIEWDGTFNNKPCPNDIYIYVVRITAISNNRRFTERRVGKITLIR